MDKKTQKAMFGSTKGDWGTPRWLYDALDQEFHFGLDAAAQDDESDEQFFSRARAFSAALSASYEAKYGLQWSASALLQDAYTGELKKFQRRRANYKHPNYFSAERSAFEHDWAEASGGRAVFLNPPYGREIVRWMARAKLEGQKVPVVVLVPARTDTRWFWESALDGASDVRLLRGRLQFEAEGATAAAPFPSAVVVYMPPVPGQTVMPPVIRGWTPPGSAGRLRDVDDEP
jgi:site-specific DNA-methyltransferase (adenine-specific)